MHPSDSVVTSMTPLVDLGAILIEFSARAREWLCLILRRGDKGFRIGWLEL